ncbi:cilia- and flagella-associated protein 161-like [Folsomia candida]|nr:cilia- and flagella-associated protein 161-like [Folsomia candida]
MDNAYYDDLPHITKPGKNLFNPETYIGNWYEETVRNTLKRNDFLRKRECGDLIIQRTQTMVDLLLKPVELTPQADGYLHYGDKIQIVSPGPSCKLASEVYPFKRNYCKLSHLILSAAVPPTSIDHAPYLNTDSIISASTLLYPVVRNSFIIEHPDCPTHVGQVIQYGDVFRIRAFDTQHFPLYLFSAPGIRLHSAATHSAKPKVRFSDLTVTETLWCAHPLDEDAKLRMELGVPIRLKTPLLLKHNGSGHNLSLEPNFPVMTYFGNELEVTLDTKLDRVKRPGFENIWYFDTDRGLPKVKDPCDKDFEKQAEFSAKININAINRSAAESGKLEDLARQKEEEDNLDEDEGNCNAMQYQAQCCPMGKRNEELDAAMSQMTLKSRGGLRPYDPATGPQPNAWSYMVQDNDPNFPNQKWNCGDTDCCNAPMTKPPKQTEDVPCDKCECIEPDPKAESPNAIYSPFKRLLM